jgi:hypothetical protein
MVLRFVAASILVAWFGLAGIVLGESTGFFEEPPDAEGSVETALAKIANCIRRSKAYKPFVVRVLFSISSHLSLLGPRFTSVVPPSSREGSPVTHPVRLHVLSKIFLI